MLRTILGSIVLFVAIAVYDAALWLRHLAGRTLRYIHARASHRSIRKAEQERDEAVRAYKALQQHHWRATNILASLNDLQTRSVGRDITHKELIGAWRHAWSKPLSEPPTINYEEIPEPREFSEWELDEVAAKLDPGAYLDDSIVIGSVVARRRSARIKAHKHLIAQQTA